MICGLNGIKLGWIQKKGMNQSEWLRQRMQEINSNKLDLNWISVAFKTSARRITKQLVSLIGLVLLNVVGDWFRNEFFAPNHSSFLKSTNIQPSQSCCCILIRHGQHVISRLIRLQQQIIHFGFISFQPSFIIIEHWPAYVR